jgi:8-oxo-dGTP pyrophosphatase MutT (NUDIX family)
MPRKWNTLSSKTLHDFRIFSIRQDRCVSPRTGKEHDLVVLQGPDWINVIPLVAGENVEQVVMIRQYRFGRGEVTLEIPGGMIDQGEDPAAAAARELREETGYVAGELFDLGAIDPNPAMQTNRCFTFLATSCRLAGGPELDEKEDIDVELVPLSEVPRLLAGGAITHALVAVAFHKLDLWMRGLLPTIPTTR